MPWETHVEQSGKHGELFSVFKVIKQVGQSCFLACTMQKHSDNKTILCNLHPLNQVTYFPERNNPNFKTVTPLIIMFHEAEKNGKNALVQTKI